MYFTAKTISKRAVAHFACSEIHQLSSLLEAECMSPFGNKNHTSFCALCEGKGSYRKLRKLEQLWRILNNKDALSLKHLTALIAISWNMTSIPEAYSLVVTRGNQYCMINNGRIPTVLITSSKTSWIQSYKEGFMNSGDRILLFSKKLLLSMPVSVVRKLYQIHDARDLIYYLSVFDNDHSLCGSVILAECDVD